MHPNSVFARRTSLAALVTGSLVLAGCSGSDGGDAASSSTPTTTCSIGQAPSFSGKGTAFDAAASIDSSSALAVQASQPTISSVEGPGKGYKFAEVKVNARVTTNGVFAVQPESFVLADKEGNTCGRPAENPLSKGLEAAQVDEGSPAAGSLAFVVPEQADLSDFTVYYLAKPGSDRAIAAWSATGAAPSASRVTTCSSNKSGLDLKGAKDQKFGKGFTTGDSQISLEITPSAPKSKTLEPGPDQPNDVRGVAVKVKVRANGSSGFVERNQFQLVDSAGNLCRYNELGSDGEDLTSALVPKNSTKTYTLVFWTPKTSEVPGWKLLYVPEATERKAVATWTLKPTPKPKESGSATASPTSKPATSGSAAKSASPGATSTK